MSELLSVDGLSVSFETDQGILCAVDNLSFKVEAGKTVGLVGESGCGKSVTSLALMRLIDSPPGHIHSGQVIFEGKDLLQLSAEEMRRVRGNKISMIFQEPMTSLNPVYTVGDQVSEVFKIHQRLGRKEAKERAIEMLDLVKISAPAKRYSEYPHQLSGGMRQRVMIAMALACEPKLLIADEPTTALDVTIQAQILSLIAELQERLGMAVLLITHDLGVVAEVCDDVLVMYAGKIVEEAPVERLFNHPGHPYTQGLLRSIPQLGQVQERLETIAGTVPSLARLPEGCRFHERCHKAFTRCRETAPDLTSLEGGSRAACWLHEHASQLD